MRREPCVGRTPNAALLLLGHGLVRIAEAPSSLLFHFDKPKLPSAPHDQVELVASGPHIRAENPPAAQPIPPRRAALRSVH